MKKRIIFSILSLTFILLCLMACRRHRFRAEISGITDIKANISIMEFKEKLYTQPNRFVEIKDDYIIGGVVVANDKGGNFYKQLVLQDESGGIAVLIDGRNLFNEFPIGRKVFVRTKGLALNDYGHNIQLGSIGQNEATKENANEDNPKQSFRLVGIPTNLTGVYLAKSTFNHPVAPLEVDIDSLKTSLHNRYQNTLIVLKNMEAAGNTKGVTLANPNPGSSRLPFGLHTLKNCNNSTVTLKTSNYALFAKELLPQGNGSVTGIFTPFHRNNRSERQISIRGMEDLDMEGARCGTKPQKKTIAEILKYPKNKPFPEGWYIEGQIISEEKNESCANYVLQDKTSGIRIRFSSPSAAINSSADNSAAYYTYDNNIDESAAKKKAKKAGAAKPKTAKPKTAKPPCNTAGFLKLDTLVRIDISGLKLGTYNRSLQIDKIPQNKVTPAKEAQPIQEKKLQNIQEVYTKGQNIVFQLVAIPNVQICKSSSKGCQTCPENTKSTTSTSTSTNCTFPIIAQTMQAGNSGSSNPNQDTLFTYVRGTSKDLLAKVQCYAKCKGGNSSNTNHLDTIKGYIQYFNGKPQITLRTEKDLVENNGSVVNGTNCPCACQANKRVQGSRRRSREGRSQ